jgi:hypothetical protein
MITRWKHTVMKLEGILGCVGGSASHEKLKACQRKYSKNWADAIKKEDGKLRTYATFKSSLSPENYLNQVKNFDHRKALTRLRTSSHSLMIETGRYTKPRKTPVQERLCKLCNEVEDEVHFLINCNLYKKERETLFHQVELKCQHFLSLNSVDRFIFLVTSEDKIVSETAKFCHSAFEHRKDWLHTLL